MWKLAILLMALGTGCVTVNPAAICDATRGDRGALADALLIDGGDQSAVAGARLIGKLDAGCGGR